MTTTGNTHPGKTVGQIVNGDLHSALLGCSGSVGGTTGLFPLSVVFRVTFRLFGLG
jgi:hypothetical protein